MKACLPTNQCTVPENTKLLEVLSSSEFHVGFMFNFLRVLLMSFASLTMYGTTNCLYFCSVLTHSLFCSVLTHSFSSFSVALLSCSWPSWFPTLNSYTLHWCLDLFMFYTFISMFSHLSHLSNDTYFVVKRWCNAKLKPGPCVFLNTTIFSEPLSSLVARTSMNWKEPSISSHMNVTFLHGMEIKWSVKFSTLLYDWFI